MFTLNQSLLDKAHAILWERSDLFWIIGGACSGKSTITQALAEQTGASVYDMDASIYGAFMSRYDAQRHPAATTWFSAPNPLAWALSLTWKECAIMHIEHVAIWTRDLERLRAFYQTYFGAACGPKYTNPRRQFESYFLTFASGARLEIMTMPAVPASLNDPLSQFTGLIHVAFSVGSKEQVDALTSRLQADSYSLLDGPRYTGDGYYESVVLDPDGNRVEITI